MRPGPKINKVRKAKVKSALKQGKSARQALREAGYSEAAVSHSTHNSVVKHSTAEIIEELRASEVTADLVIMRVNQARDLALAKGDITSVLRADELLGKYIALWTDKKVVDQRTLTQEDQSILNRYIDTPTNTNNN